MSANNVGQTTVGRVTKEWKSESAASRASSDNTTSIRMTKISSLAGKNSLAAEEHFDGEEDDGEDDDGADHSSSGHNGGDLPDKDTSELQPNSLAA
ncbi:hypothetical protein HGRIS_000702 [Hohenbuehelia grisea]|uniref:Uncharacterized protein n=1 Tax=Hohenbuehelia grisea TaxID=104357 RepID=A0ABR3JTV6_9AGAR